MAKYVAFLRGINVGGKNKIKMEDLREMFAGLPGVENVRTYINSGNVIFEAAETGDKVLVGKIETAIEERFGLKIKVMARRTSEIDEVIKNNPFAGRFENDKDLHVLFLDEPLPKEKSAALLSNSNENEMFAVRNREIYCLLKAGVPDSLLGRDYVGKKLKTPATARNWRTVNKIMEI